MSEYGDGGDGGEDGDDGEEGDDGDGGDVHRLLMGPKRSAIFSVDGSGLICGRTELSLGNWNV